MEEMESRKDEEEKEWVWNTCKNEGQVEVKDAKKMNQWKKKQREKESWKERDKVKDRQK